MSEGPPDHFEKEESARAESILEIAHAVIERNESFPFPGLGPEAHARLRAAEEEMPGYATPIDELVARFEQEGLKVALGTHPESGNVFVLRVGSDDIENDSVFPRHLRITDDMNEDLKRLFHIDRRE